MTTLADRSLELHLHGRVRFGVDAVASLPDLVRDVGAERAFVVTDPGVMGSGVAARVVGVLEDVGIGTALFDEVEANPGTTTVARGIGRAAAFGLDGTVVIPVGGGSSMDSAKVMALHAANGGEVLALGYHRDDIAPGVPVIAIPTTAGTGAETNTYGVITDEAAGRKDYVGHPSVLPRWSLLDPALTVGVPPAATAATGVDALTHSLESLLSRNPNPFAEAIALQVIRTVRDVAAAGVRRRLGHRGPLAAADGLAPGGDRAAERDRRRAGPRARPRDRDAGTAAARIGPRRHRARGAGVLRSGARAA